MRYIECDRCGRKVSEEQVHEPTIELTNAVVTAPKAHTKRQGDFCPRCAAETFRKFKERLPEGVAVTA